MRTTIEITDEQHRALAAVAQRRGVRGFSVLVQEALDAYLQELGTQEVDALLGLEGILDERDGRELQDRIDSVRASRRSS